LNLILGFSLLLLALAQQDEPKQKVPKPTQDSKSVQDAPKSKLINVFVQAWDAAEIKYCSTYDNSPYLLVCDDKRFMQSLGDAAEAGVLTGKFNQMTKEEQDEYAYTSAFNYALVHSKTFYVHFSESAWPKEPTKQRKLALWECAKDKEVTCTSNGRAK
jgi:hypothetical protein